MPIGTPTLLDSGSSTVSSTTCATGGSAGTAPAGCLIVAFSYMRVNVASTATFSDTASLSWTNLDFQVGGTGGCTLHYAQAPSGVSAGWVGTTTWNNSGNRKLTTAYYVTGLASSSVEDTAFRPTGVSGATGNSSITAAAASAQADEIFFTIIRHNAASTGVTNTPQSGWTELDDTLVSTTTVLQGVSMYRIPGAIETPTVASNFSDTTTNWATGLVAFQMAASTATPLVEPILVPTRIASFQGSVW